METFCLLILAGRKKNGILDSCPVSLVDSVGEQEFNVEVVIVVTAVFLSKAWAVRTLPSIRPSSYPFTIQRFTITTQSSVGLSATNKHLPLHGPTDFVIIVLLPAG
ncbi:uncharacterized protein TrAtP1_002767 [Trichoderma atroviride]|uniref:Uncharacterized protein n=1 Tax=Hypocrea atroviridis (strain ATCC 20476 / IMI 206040) TaxID=452589 RepID=G9NX04_HYPAI|nr:uncharacterized protein TRIATDRAFT_318277 [Trichoderma atroviride IMI 206040]EHK44657.1 hypothetical protein TRIATDRAFT_318277 [Trichoderma atroviride IMI 206040]UKZ61504.1 hypothetical protein TrAtP1_002767 [Trichoderma atroviride]